MGLAYFFFFLCDEFHRSSAREKDKALGEGNRMQESAGSRTRRDERQRRAESPYGGSHVIQRGPEVFASLRLVPLSLVHSPLSRSPVALRPCLLFWPRWDGLDGAMGLTICHRTIPHRARNSRVRAIRYRCN